MILAANAAGLPDPNAGRFLQDFDADANDGMGRIVTTEDQTEALRFPNLEVALATWKRQSRIRPLRDDGLPNLPLSAYTVTFETAA
jgi:cation diffusion facilitator CzcD-associated flavoprotein CzcO